MCPPHPACAQPCEWLTMSEYHCARSSDALGVNLSTELFRAFYRSAIRLQRLRCTLSLTPGE